MAPAAPTVQHTSAKAGRSPEANQTRRCQDLGNLVHFEHLNLEASSDPYQNCTHLHV